jgi:hypothetical protein
MDFVIYKFSRNESDPLAEEKGSMLETLLDDFQTT